MSTFDANNAETEANGSGQNGRHQRHRRRRRRPSMAASSETTTDGSFQFSDSESDQSWHSPLGSLGDGICEPQQQIECFSDEEIIDLESGDLELNKLHKEEKDCRICHLSLFKSGGIGNEHSIGMAIELGCSCKGDLAAAHKHCAETWFKTKGNTICEICGTNALTIAGEQTNEGNNATVATVAAPVVLSENPGFWHGRRVMNFLLTSMVFAFVISWLFHFNILP